MGEPVRVGHFTYRVAGAEWLSSLGAGRARPSAAFLAVVVEARNEDTTASTVPTFQLEDDRGARHDSSAEGLGEQGAFGLFEQVNPGVQRRGFVLFDVPRDRRYRLRLRGGLLSSATALVELEAGIGAPR